MQQEMEFKKSEELIVKESDFLGFQKIKTDKTIENYKKAIKTNNIQLLKNKTELESKEKLIAELKTSIESLKKEISLFKNKNISVLTNPKVFAVEKKKYLDSVMNTLTRTILSEKVKTPNIHGLSKNEVSTDKAIEDSTELGESTPFIEFMLEMIYKSIQNIKDDNVPINVPKNDPIKRVDKIIEIISENKDITIVELANKLDVADKTIKRDIAKLKEQNRLIRVGSLKSGYWEIKG
jgi:biotin operon repressor